MYEKGKQ